VSAVEILSELRKIRGKFLRDEGIYIFPKPDILMLTPRQITTTPQLSDLLDFTAFGGLKLFFMYNTQDVPVFVDFLTSYSPTGEFIPIREGVEVPANGSKIGVLSERHVYMKLRMYTNENPTSGQFMVSIARWSM